MGFLTVSGLLSGFLAYCFVNARIRLTKKQAACIFGACVCAGLAFGLWMDKDLYALPPDELAKVPQVCGSLREALENLKADHGFLLKGGVFSQDFIDSYIDLKMEDVYAFEHTPHPVEFKMYYSV